MVDHLTLLREVRSAANGMLPLEVYEKIFELGRASAGGTFVEIGTAHGAGTISLALGAQLQSQPFHIWTVDPFSGAFSSRSQYGTVADNISYVRKQFERFGVAGNISIVPGSVVELKSYDLEDVSILILDADGRIDRDLAELFPLLSEDCRIVIDDIDEWVGLSRVGQTSFFDQKHKISHLLVENYSAMGLLQKDEQIAGTGFYSKGPNSVRTEEVLLAALPAYRELVFTPFDASPSVMRHTIRGWVAQNIPGARRAYRSVRAVLRGARPAARS